MEELSRKNHRQRVRDSYLNHSFESMQDHNVLEMILFYAIPRRDVKETAYALLNHFGSLENVLKADINELQKVKGVGENTAILLSLFDNVCNRIMLNRNDSTTSLLHHEMSKTYVANLLQNLHNERVIMISLASNLDIIACHTLADGTVTCANVEPRKIISYAISDHAAAVILGHNHPGGSYLPSEGDLVFTEKIKDMLRVMDIRLNDHIVVGQNGTLSMRNDMRYQYCFN